MTARMRRLASDYEQVKKDFAGHKNIIVTPVGDEPPEKYHVTYFVNGIYLLPDGRIETLGRHEVEITLHADYPRYKPICKILTPIWHPNFRDGQICIGDIWGAGESLSDIIINIGDMIQYKSWNSYSPLSADAAQWAMENKHLFPVGNIDLYTADYASSKETVEIDLFDDGAASVQATTSSTSEPTAETSDSSIAVAEETNENDFEITAEELEGIEFVPTAQRMQTVSHGGVVKGNKVNFKTVFMKGILWGLIGGILGFILQEALDSLTSSDAVLGWMGYDSIMDLLDMDTDTSLEIIKNAVRISSAFFSASIAFGLGMLMGIGEGVFYGSKEKAIKNGLMGAGISLLIGFASGYIAQAMYSAMLSDNASDFASAIVRGLGWAVMGLGVGASVGLIKPEKKRVLFCSLGGTIGGFVGGFLFNYITGILTFGENDTGTFSRAVGIIIMGVLIGLGIGLLEQFAKAAWLKVIRGEFEGKEYLLFAGTTSIGNNGKNTIVLFKDKLVGPHHCDIKLEGSKYVLTDCGTPMGTIVNGQKTVRHVLRQGDAIAIGNSVLVFNTK
ncbi:MAG: FHA domain-containing protein [Neglectibacter timonensis]